MSGNFIECNDEGVDYTEARVNCLLRDVLKKPNIGEITRKLLPIQIKSEEATTGRVLLVKVNLFECSGMAIGVCISHKIADASTFATFMKSWATATMAQKEEDNGQLISLSSLFPPIDLPTAETFEFKVERYPVRRFVIDGSKISTLKAKAGSAAVPYPTRIEAVTALIWKCAMAAATSNRGGLEKPSALFQAVNLRRRMNPPLPENSVGNLVSNFIAEATPTDDSESSDQLLPGLVQQLRNAIREFCENYVRKLEARGSLAVSAILENVEAYKTYYCKDEIDFYLCTSWCRFGLNGVDFGWGRPGWVTPGFSTSVANSIVLMDTDDGEGIEAWICLNEEEMGFFQTNQELLQFADVVQAPLHSNSSVSIVYFFFLLLQAV